MLMKDVIGQALSGSGLRGRATLTWTCVRGVVSSRPEGSSWELGPQSCIRPAVLRQPLLETIQAPGAGPTSDPLMNAVEQATQVGRRNRHRRPRSA